MNCRPYLGTVCTNGLNQGEVLCDCYSTLVSPLQEILGSHGFTGHLTEDTFPTLPVNRCCVTQIVNPEGTKD